MKRLVLLAAIGAALLPLGCAEAVKVLNTRLTPTPAPPVSCPDGLPVGTDGTCNTAKRPDPPPVGPPTRPTPPCSTPPPADQHVPVCANGNVSECWHQPPEGWRYNCAGGAPTVLDPKECAGGSTPPPSGGGGDVPHSGWAEHPEPALPTLVETVNATLAELTGCGVNSDCAVASGGWANYDAFQVRFVEAMRAKGFRSGFHTEPNHPDETCTYPSGADFCEGYKVATDGGKIKVGWAAKPTQACYGGRDEHGSPVGLGCPGVGGGSYRGNWRSSAVPAPPTPPTVAAPPALSKLLCSSVGAGRVVVDCTPKTCADPAWCAAHSTGGSCCPGGGEHDPAGRQAVEAAWGPYSWTINGSACPAEGVCWLDGGNPLRLVAPGAEGRAIRCTGGNGVFGEVVP